MTTEHFYAAFKSEYTPFFAAIEGVSDETARKDYATCLLKRLIVLYFLQQQGLFNGDRCYLSSLLHQLRQQQGHDLFYRHVLLPLFQQQHDQPLACLETMKHLFHTHALEEKASTLHIPDAAFTRLFAFLDSYHWTLDRQTIPEQAGRRTTSDRATLTPDILTHLFEEHLNQKQMGAYYTGADVSGYIAQNTIIPYLFTTLAQHSPETFQAEAPVWQLLQEQPDRYIPRSLRNTEHLPKETEREYQTRCMRYAALQQVLREGSVCNIHDLVSYNLDLQCFARDAIQSCQKPEPLLMLFGTLERLTILDPTCGSGAFLFAALDVLTPLYTLCLERLSSLDDAHSATLRPLLERVARYPSPHTFALASIIGHNLYGVDLMEGAIELCKLRLFLALAAHVHDPEELRQPPDFHVYQGNVLVDFTWQKVYPAVMQRGGFDIILGNPPYIEYSQSRKHYVVTGYEQSSCGNLYAAVIERVLTLCHPGQSYLGLIVPLSICSGERFQALRARLTHALQQLWLANFEIFPCRLFDGAFQRLSLLIARHGDSSGCKLHVTRIQRWYAPERPHLLDLITYTPVRYAVKPQVFPKLATPLQEIILCKLLEKAGGTSIAQVHQHQRTTHFVYYQEATNYWTKAVCHVPFYKKNGLVREPSHGRFLFFHDETTAQTIMALMNSSLFYLWFATYSDGFHLSHALVTGFPLGMDLFQVHELAQLSQQLEEDILVHARFSTRNTRCEHRQNHERHLIELAEYHMGYSKPLLDQIDQVLARYYNLNEKEHDFIINYDIKYRMGKK